MRTYMRRRSSAPAHCRLDKEDGKGTHEVVHDASHVIGYLAVGRVIRKDLIDRDFGRDEEFRL